MESLRGIFPSQPIAHKRDFLKENVLKIRNIQRKRVPSDSEYSTKFNNQRQRKLSLSNAPQHLALSSRKVPINSLGSGT